MKTFKKINWKKYSNVALGVVLAVVLLLSGLQISIEKQPNELPKVVLKVGEISAYSGTPDYIGLTDVVVQQALNALPATGGEIQLISPAYTFSNTVSRAINNVTITGQNGTTITYAGAAFSVGAQTGWKFQDIRISVGGSITNFANAQLDHVVIGATTYESRLPDGTGYSASGTSTLTTLSATTVTASTLNAPTGGAYVIAASNATDDEKRHANVIDTSNNLNSLINTAILANFKYISLSSGTFIVNRSVYLDAVSDVEIKGSGYNTIIKSKNQSITTLTQNIIAGDTHIHVSDASIFVEGEDICIFNGVAIYEVKQISSIAGNQLNTTAWTNGFSIGNEVYSAWTVFDVYNSSKVAISDMTIDGNKANWTRYAVACNFQYVFTFSQCQYCYGNQLNIINGVRMGSGIRNSYNTIINQSIFKDNNGAGFFYESGNDGSFVTNSASVNNETDGYFLEDATNSNVVNCSSIGNLYGIRLTVDASYNNISGNYIDLPINGQGIRLGTTSAYNNIISCNTIYGSGAAVAGIEAIQDSDIAKNTINGNSIYGNINYGIYLYGNPQNEIFGNTINTNTFGIWLRGKCDYTQVISNIIKAPDPIYSETGLFLLIDGNTLQGSGSSVVGHIAVDISNGGMSVVSKNIIFEIRRVFNPPSASLDNTQFINNRWFDINTIWNSTPSRTIIIKDNPGYIASGEVRNTYGTLSAGNANAIGFAWHDPELQDILIKKIVIYVTTGGGTAGSHLDVGIADDATGTNRGTEFFNDLTLETAGMYDSMVAAGGGTQTVWVFCQDSASATDGWIVGQILDANAASLVATYYIEYVGK